MEISLEQLQKDMKNLDIEISNHFKQFENARQKLMNDGIVNIEEYFNSPIKIMWILKEPYDNPKTGGGGWSMVKALENGLLGKGKDANTWNRIIQCSYSILHDFQKFENMPKIKDNKEMKAILKSIAFINVSKLPGKTKTSTKGLNIAYKLNKEILLNQIDRYKPDIIIGGSTLHLFKNDLGITKENELEGGHFFKGKKLFINTKHPSQRKISSKDYVNKIIERSKQWKYIYN